MDWVRVFAKGRSLNVLDIGCGAGRNGVPLAQAGHRVFGVDQSEFMIAAARQRAQSAGVNGQCEFVKARMDTLPVSDTTFDLIIAQGIWNLAASDDELLSALREADRVSRSGTRLFVFPFSRDTLSPDALPQRGQQHIYDQFSGSPQAFFSQESLTQLLAEVGFDREGSGSLTKYNDPGILPPGRAAPRPVIWEGTWIHR